MADEVEQAEIRVTENPDAEEFTILVDGEPAGATVYRRHGEDYAFMHTTIDDRFEGRGLGSILVRESLDEVRVRGAGVLPYCPFVMAWMRKHPEYLELVPVDRRERFGLLP